MHPRSFLFALILAASLALGFGACSATTQHVFGQGGGGGQSGPSGSGGNAVGSSSTGLGVGGGGLHFEGGTGDCTNLQCVAVQDNCAGKGKPSTTISGTVYDPAGKLPLYNVYVYVPNTKPDPILTGDPTCTQCEAPASGNPVIGVLTDAKGDFTLQWETGDKYGVPSGVDVPLVLQVGKWRRQIVIPKVNACEANPLPNTAAERLRLPAKSSEGDMPLIAFTSGCDPAECFLRDIGIDDSEFVAPGNAAGHVHFFTGFDGDTQFGTSASSVPGGNTTVDTYTWWLDPANLLKYDIIFNACECNPNDRDVYATGSANAYNAMESYLQGGGRVFTTHYYYNWFAPSTGPTDEQGVVKWDLAEQSDKPFSTFFIDDSFPKGKAYADWLQAQGVTQSYGVIKLTDTRWDINKVTPEATRWIYNANSKTAPNYVTMYMSFNSPVGMPTTQQCGRAVFSGVHLSGTSTDGPFPSECAGQDPSYAVNEKALEFLFFDLSSCVQDNSMPPPPPPPT